MVTRKEHHAGRGSSDIRVNVFGHRRSGEPLSTACPAINHEFVLRAISQMPGHMRHALGLLFLNNMTADEVAEKLGLDQDVIRDYLMMARKAGLDVETRFRPDADGM